MSTIPADVLPTGVPESLRIRPWRELALIASIMMELSWVALWYRIFIPSEKQVTYLMGLLILTGMLMAIYLPNRIMSFLDIRLILRRIILFFLVLVNLYVGLKTLLYINEPISLYELFNRPVRTFNDMANLIPAEFVAMLFVLVVSWRGVSYSDRHIGPINVLASFRLGILMFFLYGLILPLIGESPNLALYIFLFFSLFALSTARISVLSQLRGGHHIRFNRQWMLGITSIILLMVGLSAFAIAFTSDRLFGYISILMTWFIYLVVLILSPLLWLLIRFLFWLLEVIQIGAIFSALGEVFTRLGSLLQAIADWAANLTSRFNFEPIEIFLRRLSEYKSIYLWMILLIGVGVLLLMLRRYVFKENNAAEQDAQTLVSQQDLINLLKDALRRGLDRFANNIEDILRLNQVRQLLAAARIRRIYANLLNLSSKLDRPRLASQTPLEFLPSLEGLFPGLSRELGTITGAYLLVRYGELPETAHNLEEVEVAWRQVSAAGQEQLKTKKRGRSG